MLASSFFEGIKANESEDKRKLEEVEREDEEMMDWKGLLRAAMKQCKRLLKNSFIIL